MSLTDLVKNHITEYFRAQTLSLDEAKLTWAKILEIIEGSTKDLLTDSYLHHFWLSRFEYLPQKKIFKALKRKGGGGTSVVAQKCEIASCRASTLGMMASLNDSQSTVRRHRPAWLNLVFLSYDPAISSDTAISSGSLAANSDVPKSAA